MSAYLFFTVKRKPTNKRTWKNKLVSGKRRKRIMECTHPTFVQRYTVEKSWRAFCGCNDGFQD
jgi:hypothetical protein